jgi:RND family efflux transporter MFP subunit
VYWLIKASLKQTPPPTERPRVLVQKPQTKTIRNYVSQTGTMVAYNSVNLVARIKGYLIANEFTDGSFVKKGKELFLIEPEPYQDKLKEAQAKVAAAKANSAYAKAEHERQQRMYKQNATSLNSVQIWLAKEIEAQAQIDGAIANAESAAIDYSYTHVLAPFDGRIGRHLVDPGNLVGNGEATNLATIEQIDPIYVYFNLNELDLIKIREMLRRQNHQPGQLIKVPVDVKMQNETDFVHRGTLDFVNTGLNASTGTMEFRARLTNTDYVLVPGLFVQVRIPVSKGEAQLTIPDTAILYDQVGPYVFIVDKENYVKLIRVTLGALEQGLRAITKGLGAEDRVVTAGLQNAVPGNQVSVTENGTKQE